jgi:hypothetical protein
MFDDMEAGIGHVVPHGAVSRLGLGRDDSPHYFIVLVK